MKALESNIYVRRWISFALGLMLLVVPHLGYPADAGNFQFVMGEIKVISGSGTEHVPVKGDVFNAGDTIVTGASGSAQIRMSDGGQVAVRPDTQMKLDQYVFSGREDGTERKVVSLIKGGFRAITGLIGNRNKKNYRILTPAAIIGIRGTDHEAVVIPPGATGAFQAGTYDRVYRGATIIETDKGKLIVNPNQVGFTPGKGAAPVLLPKIPEFFEAKGQKPDVAKDQQKEAKDSATGDSPKLETANEGSPRSLSPALDTNQESDSKDTLPLLTPLDTAKVKEPGGKKSRIDALATLLDDTTIDADLKIASTKSAVKGDDLSSSKGQAAKPKSKEGAPAPITNIALAPIAATGPGAVATPLIVEALATPIATNLKLKPNKKP